MFGLLFELFGVKSADKAVQTRRVRVVDNESQTATRKTYLSIFIIKSTDTISFFSDRGNRGEGHINSRFKA